MTESTQPTMRQSYGVSSAWAHLAMCAATAVLLTLAFPLPGWSFMAFFALVPVGVLAMRTRRLWTLAWTSYLVFLIWWVLRVLWLRHVQVFAPLGIAVVCAAYFTVALVALAAVQRRFRGAMTITLPIFWCAQEFARSLWPLGGFAWFTLASSQAAWRDNQHPGFLVQSADLFGWVTVSFLVAMASGLMVDLIARPLTKRRETGGIRPRRTIVVAVLLWVSCTAGAIVYGGVRIGQTPDADNADTRTVTIGIVQTNVPQDNKLQNATDETRWEDFQTMLGLSADAARDQPAPDLIVWPETMVTAYINDEAYQLALQQAFQGPGTNERIIQYREAVQAHADEAGVPLVVGGSAFGFAQHNRTMNSAMVVTPGGDTLSRYSKMHLVPMGEYIPGPQWLRDSVLDHISPYDYDYTVEPGAGVVIFELDVGAESPGTSDAPAQPVRYATPICYEDAVAFQCRKMVYARDGTKRADLLVNLTNDGWYPGSHQGYQHLQLAVLRCIENRVPMARSVNTGVSGLIDSAGRVGPLVNVSGEHQAVAGHANAVAVLDDRVSLYGRVREGFGVGLGAAAVLLLLGVLVPSGSKRRGG